MGIQIPVWQGDYGYALNFLLVKGDATNSPFDLTGATELLFRGQRVSLTHVRFQGTMSVLNPTAGLCQYIVQAGNFSTAAQYNVQIQVSFSGAVETFGDIVVTANPKIPY